VAAPAPAAGAEREDAAARRFLDELPAAAT
jgi:hypothetical protein